MLIIEVEDAGQDFTEFHVNDQNQIVDARPFQAWLWRGFNVSQRSIRLGGRLKLTKPGAAPMTLRYSVIAIREVEAFPV